MSVTYCELRNGIHLVVLSGPLNDGQAEAVMQAFTEISEQGGQRVVLSLKEVPFIDSRGLAALIAGYKIFGRDGAHFRMAGVQDQPRLLLELTGFDRVFRIYDSLTEALPSREPDQVLLVGSVLELAVAV